MGAKTSTTLEKTIVSILLILKGWIELISESPSRWKRRVPGFGSDPPQPGSAPSR